MTGTRRLTLLLALVTAVTFAPPAHASVDPTGFLCSFPVESAQSQTTDDIARGGPLLLAGSGGEVYSGSITCTFQVDAPTHDGPDYASFTGPVTPGVAYAQEHVVYPTPHGGWAYECTQVNLTNGTTLYWDAADQYSDGRWSTDPGASCPVAPYWIGPAPPCVECEVCLFAVGALPPGVEPPVECPDP